MTQVWKYTLGTHAVVEMPAGAELLHVAWQHRAIQVWARVEPEAPKETRQFHVVGTGRDLPEGAGRYVGSAVTETGTYVFHVFEQTPIKAARHDRKVSNRASGTVGHSLVQAGDIHGNVIM